jgi:hypothetical protein
MPIGLFAHVRNHARGALWVGHLGSRGSLRSEVEEDIRKGHRETRQTREKKNLFLHVYMQFSTELCNATISQIAQVEIGFEGCTARMKPRRSYQISHVITLAECHDAGSHDVHSCRWLFILISIRRDVLPASTIASQRCGRAAYLW